MNVGDVLEQTDNYIMRLGKDLNHDLNYQIVNKKTNVIEAETKILSQAYQFLQELQVSLVVVKQMFHDEIKKKTEEPKIPGIKNVVSINKKELEN